MKKQNLWLLICGGILVLGIFKCTWYEIFGVPCPTCGMTRAWQSFIMLDFATAFSMHPLFLLPLLVFIPKARNVKVLLVCVAIFILVYILRMCLLFPHTAPMNYNYDSLLGGFFK